MSLENKTILVVEDDEGSRQLIKELLGFQSYAVVEAESGQQALSVLAKHAVDLILMDISLPDISGLALMRKIKAQQKYIHLPIIALTAYVRPADEKAALDAGAATHIPKPVNIQTLLTEIQRQLIAL
jgi:CheY-like chemotaxis protein